jgi:hypothetical protein
MAQAVSNAAITVSLTQRESSALASLLYSIQDENVFSALKKQGINSRDKEILSGLWNDMYAKDTNI